MGTILVATDFSARSDRALRRAVLESGRLGADLMLVHVIDDDQPAYMIERQREVAEELLGDAVRTFSDVDKVRADMTIRTGDPFAAILDAADDVDAQMIVIGPHRPRLSDMIFGTTAQRTIGDSSRPLLVANSMPSGPYRRILLAIDKEEASKEAALAARKLGIFDEAQLLTLHVFDAPALGMMQRAMEVPEAIDHYVSSEEQRASAAFGEFLSGLGLPPSRQMLRPDRGSPAHAILACAEEEAADLILVGSGKRSGVERLFVRSVAKELLRESPRDLLVVPLAGEDAKD